MQATLLEGRSRGLLPPNVPAGVAPPAPAQGLLFFSIARLHATMLAHAPDAPARKATVAEDAPSLGEPSVVSPSSRVDPEANERRHSALAQKLLRTVAWERRGETRRRNSTIHVGTAPTRA